MGARRGFAGLAIAVGLVLSIAGTARAANPLGLGDCGRAQGTYQCSGLAKTWDGVPLDTTVTLPSEHARHLPLVVEIHGFGNSKWEYLDPESTAYTDNAFHWARDGYAVLTYTARGLWGSCGTPESRLASPVDCADGYIHLADVRYEVRDTQTLIGRLVDQGVADRHSIGVTGDSYGGGQSFMLAALRDRVMLPGGKLVPWRSPRGTPLRIAAAAPVIPWTDLIAAAAPNGSTRANRITPRNASVTPVGVEKASFVNAIFAAAQTATGPGQPVGEPFIPGRPMGFLSPPGTDPEADVTSWVKRTDEGEPYQGKEVEFILDQLRSYHSAYYIDAGERPAPLFVGSGFTDDLFPVDEALRFANRTRKRYPGAPISLLFGDLGHQRASNKSRERDRLVSSIHGWFDHYLRGRRGHPRNGATAYVDTCPRSTPSLGPFHARTFAGLSGRALRFRSPEPQRILSTGGDPQVGAALDPAAGGGNACVSVSSRPEPGTAAYDLPKRHRGATLIGAPSIKAQLSVGGANPANAQIAARLWDVSRDGSGQRLVARGTYRPHEGRNRWQLHPTAWRFKKGHTPRLQLLGSDAPYARPSNGQFQVDVKSLRLRLPIHR